MKAGWDYTSTARHPLSNPNTAVLPPQSAALVPCDGDHRRAARPVRAVPETLTPPSPRRVQLSYPAMATIDGRPALYELSLKQLRELMEERGPTAVDIVNREYGGCAEICRKLHSNPQRGEPDLRNVVQITSCSVVYIYTSGYIAIRGSRVQFSWGQM